ncbi:hypothetical protein EV183_001156 [Coemansia sp. RSA 2336]|nr:hypothetical protein EV183_001156 [Coemansia sp. RSA 2336]
MDYTSYSVDEASRQSQSNAATSQTSIIEQDRIIEDIRQLYPSELDAEDSMMESFLSTHSRNLSEYVGHGSGSPGGHSTNSVDISDSDYRIRRNLDKAARDIREISSNGSAGRGIANGTRAISEVLPRAASEHIRSPEIAPRANPLYEAVSANRSPSFTAALQVFQNMQSSQQSSNGSKESAQNGRKSLPAKPHKQPLSTNRPTTASPELGKPTPLGAPMSLPRLEESESQELTSGRDHTSDTNILSDDDEYPDPLSFLESRSPNPQVKSPLGADNNEPTADSGKGQADDATAVQAAKPWRGLGKRRRKPSNSEYTSGPLPMVIDKDGRLSADPYVSSRSLDVSQPRAEHDSLLQRSYSNDANGTPTTRRIRASFQPWSPSKRIRMSAVDSPDNISEHGAQAHAASRPEETQADTGNVVVLAEASSSYPTTSSTAPQMPSSHENRADHVPQTPDEYPNAQSSGVVNELELSPEPSSRESTVPLADSPINDEEAAEEEKDNSASDESYAESASSQDNNSNSESTRATSTPSTSSSVRRSARIARKSEQVTPQPSEYTLRKAQQQALTTARARRTQAKVVRNPQAEPGAATQPQPSRQRRPTISRRITMCQRLLQLSKLSKDAGQMDIRMDPALAQPARLLGHDLRTSAFAMDAISAPSTPTRRAAFSGTMRVLGESEPMVTDSDRLRYMCKVKGLVEGTGLSAREALRVLYFFTGDWVSARKYVLHGQSALEEDCMWSASEDEVLLQGFDFEQMQELRMRKGNVEVYRRLQFLNTFHGLKQQ